MEITEHEQACLASLEGKLDHIRDGVRGVVKGYHTGLFIYGEGGTSKSYTVTKELERLQANWIMHNSRLTGRGFFDALASAPTATHFIEDAETLMDDKTTLGVMRSALWSQCSKRPSERPITWGAFNTSRDFVFTGGVIILSNANLADRFPEVRAIKSRIKVLHLDINGEEVKALMKRIALEGYSYGADTMTPDDCMLVRAFIIDRLGELNRNLDLRLMTNGFKDFIQWNSGDSKLHWKELLVGRIQERAIYRPRAEIKGEESQLAIQIHMSELSHQDKMKKWRTETGLSERAFYRSLNRTKRCSDTAKPPASTPLSKSMSHEFVDPKDLRNGPIRHDSLSSELLSVIAKIHGVLGKYLRKNLEQFEISFMRDSHPEQEVAIWNLIAKAWSTYHHQYLNGTLLDQTEEEKLIGALSAISMGVLDESSLGVAPEVGRKLISVYEATSLPD